MTLNVNISMCMKNSANIYNFPSPRSGHYAHVGRTHSYHVDWSSPKSPELDRLTDTYVTKTTAFQSKHMHYGTWK